MILIIFMAIMNLTLAQQPVQKSDKLRSTLSELIKSYKATIGIAIMEIESRDTLSINQQHRYPMQSVYKFPLALAVLDKVDKKEISLGDKIHISKDDLKDDTWSPIKSKYPEGEIDLTVYDLLYYSVSMSDNIACDLLFRLMKGPSKVNKYIHSLGLTGIEIKATEHRMHSGWKYQYQNWCLPMTMTQMLAGLQSKKYLSDSSNTLLLHLMTESSNSPLRIKGKLPEGTIVAHKTGTSDTNSLGMRAGCNDVGIITLPDGQHIAITVYVSDSFETFEKDEEMIALIAKVIYNYYQKTTME